MSEVTKPLMLDENFTGFREQFKNVADDIHNIALKMSPEFPLDTWAEFRKAIQHGYGPTLYPVGTDITIGNDPTMTVVGYNQYPNPNGASLPTVMLLAKGIYKNLQFDSPEAFYYAENGLDTGTYHFTLPSAYSSWAAGTYQFTLAQAVPAGGQLCISGYADAALTARKVVSYPSQTSTTKIEEVTITSGSGGTDLGSWQSTVMNHPQRVSYGSNNYKESALRQFLRSTGTGFWTPQTKFDRPPSWVASETGFLSLISEDFVNAVGEVTVGHRTNNVYEAPDSTCGGLNVKYETTEKFFLASMSEVGLGTEGAADGSFILPYYVGAENVDRIKYNGASAGYWWLRSPNPSSAFSVRTVGTSGALHYNNAIYSYGCVPACVIY